MKHCALLSLIAMLGTIAPSAGALAQGAAPAIVVHPTNRVAALGGTAALTVQATGTPLEIEPQYPVDETRGLGEYAQFYVLYNAVPKPTFQWRINGHVVPGETNWLLLVRIMSTEQAGGYSVVLSNAFGVATSRVARLTIILFPPEFAWHPRDLTVKAGDQAYFTVGARGSPVPVIQWLHNDTHIPGATNYAYSFTAGFTNQEGGYSAVLSNQFGVVTSGVARLTVVLSEPRFEAQPRGATLVEGAGVRFSVALSNSLPAHFQWQFNGTELPGATNPVLRLVQVLTTNSGGYQLIAWNDAGRATSDVATLTVRLPEVLDRWHWRRPFPQGNDLYSVTHDGTRFIAAGDTGPIVTSTNGVDWMDEHRIGDLSTRRVVVAGNGVLVSLSEDGFQVSTNGFVWGASGPETGFHPRAIAFGDEQFIAVGDTADESTSALVSTNGHDWQLLPPLSLLSIDNVAFEGGRFFAIRTGWGPFNPLRLFTSLDGANWGESQDFWLDYYTATGFAFGNGRYLAAFPLPDGIPGFGIVGLSSDGTNWTLHAVRAASPFSPSRVAYGHGRFVGIGRAVLAASPNGLDWTLVPGIATNGLIDVTFAAGRFVGVGYYGAIVTSTDGLNWSQPCVGGSDRNFRDVTRGGGLYVAVGNDGMLFTSPDGAAWTERASGTANNLRAVTYFQNRFVIVGEEDEAGATVLTSTDCATWRRSTAPGNLFGLAHNGERLVAVGDVGVVATSTDGLSWSNVFGTPAFKPTGNQNLNAVTWGGGQFVAVGRAGTVIVSTNGLHWTAESFGSRNLHGVAYGNGVYVAVARGGWVAFSSDAADWETRQLDTTDDFSDIGFGGGQFLAVGENGLMFSSTNGVDWIRRITPSQYDLRAAHYAAGSFHIAGDNETLLQSGQIAPDMRITSQMSDGTLWIEIHPETGRNCRLQGSSDLAHWTDLLSFTGVDGKTHYKVKTADGESWQFYRVVCP